MNPIWILAYLMVTVSSSGRVSYEPYSIEMGLKTCFETMWQLDEVTIDTYGDDGKVNGGYKKFTEIHCRPKTDDPK